MALPAHEILFDPVRIGPKTLRNRFYVVPHGPGYGGEKPHTRARYLETKAEGGWAAVCTGICAISPDADISPVRADRLWDDDDIRRFVPLTEAAHRHGALAGVELGHGGSDASSRDPRWPLLAPSQLASDGHSMRVPKAMELADIRRVQQDWVAAARRARSAGFDIVYVYGGHTHLPTQFLSSFYNKRTDAYGGSLRNRARFWLETLELVKEAVGDSCAVASRLSIMPHGPAGVGLDEALEFVQMADHLVDLWDVNIGSMAEWSLDSGPSRFVDQGHQTEWTRHVAQVSDKPVVGVGRLTDPDHMARIVRDGDWSLIGAARPSIADPFLPNKIQEGRLSDLRECIGCNICIATVNSSHMVCTQNATVGEEYRRGWHPERFDATADPSRPILVVGAGPAGLECGAVLGRRGFEYVHVVDANRRPGGALEWASRLPGLTEWRRVIDWRVDQINQLRNVELIPRNRLTAEDVLDYGAEIVIVATGARWSTTGLNNVTHEAIPGASADLPHALTPEQIMVDGKEVPGDHVVVYDAEGHFVGTAMAERLAREGRRVTYVTPLPVVAPFTDETLEAGYVAARLHELRVRTLCEHVLSDVTASTATVASRFGEATTLEMDAVVLVTQRCSQEQLYLELAERVAREPDGPVQTLYRVGDCVAPRLLADSIFDGHRLARELDGADAAVPLPFLREEPVVSAIEDAAAAIGGAGQLGSARA